LIAIQTATKALVKVNEVDGTQN